MPCVAKGRVISVVGENDVAGETDALFEFAGCLAKGRTQRRSVSLLADRSCGRTGAHGGIGR